MEEGEDSKGESLLKITVDPDDYAKAGKEAYDTLVAEASSSVKWISPKFFKKSLATAIKKDNGIIMSMLGQCGEWKPAEDEKLKSLLNLVAKKHKDEKVLVFTQYSDTAQYLATQLKAMGVTSAKNMSAHANMA